MPKQKTNAKFIIKQSLKVFRNQGYHSTSMSDIATNCGLLKGSLYHYFRSKEALMATVIDHLHDYYKREVFIHAYNDQLGPAQKLQLLSDISENHFFSSDSGCLMGNLALETAGDIPEFTEKIQAFFEDWIAAMTYVFAQKFEQKKAKQLGRESVVEVEGAIMMMRLFKDKKFLKDAHQSIFNKLTAE